MQNWNKRLIVALTFGALIVTLFTNCNNDPASIGLGVLPTSDFLEAGTDSQKIVAKNIYPENILSDGFSKEAVGIIGYLNDPRIGATKADMVAEINAAVAFDSLNLDGVNYFPDSVILSLHYKNLSWYGDKNTKLHVKVHELTERLGAATPYYSNKPMEGNYDATLLGEAVILPNAHKTDSAWSSAKTKTVQIKLSSEFADKLFEIKNISTVDKESRDKIKDVVNGLYITVEDKDASEVGALLRIEMLNPSTNVTLHYRKEVFDKTNQQVLSITKQHYTFPISTEGRVFNRFSHTPLPTVVQDDSDAPELYIQGMAGSLVEIDLSPIYKQWRDSISNAADKDYSLGFSLIDLIFHVDTSKMALEEKYYFPMSSNVILLVKNEKGGFEYPVFTKDNNKYSAFVSSGVSTFSEKEKTFKFHMYKEYFEQVLDGTIEEQLFYLRLPTTAFNFNRVALYNSHPTLYPKVKVKYVKY